MIKAIFLIASLWNTAHLSDSLRMETINGQQFIIHEVGERETLYGLSKRYGVIIARILEFNPKADAGLETGQMLKIPYVAKARVQTADGTIHTVQPKETLFAISRMYSVTVDEIKLWNNLQQNALSNGQQLLIKKSTSNGLPVVSGQKSSTGVHTVAAGETMFSISRLYGVTIDQIKAWNSLSSNELKMGQALKISGAANKPAPVPNVVAATPVKTEPAVKQPTQEPVRENPIKISENVAGTDEIHELGIAELIEGTEGNRKYLALHRTAKTGSILKVRNELNNREVFVRVAGPLPNTGVNDKIVIKISKSAFDRLGAIDQKFRVEVTYYK